MFTRESELLKNVKISKRTGIAKFASTTPVVEEELQLDSAHAVKKVLRKFKKSPDVPKGYVEKHEKNLSQGKRPKKVVTEFFEGLQDVKKSSNTMKLITAKLFRQNGIFKTADRNVYQDLTTGDFWKISEDRKNVVRMFKEVDGCSDRVSDRHSVMQKLASAQIQPYDDLLFSPLIDKIVKTLSHGIKKTTKTKSGGGFLYEIEFDKDLTEYSQFPEILQMLKHNSTHAGARFAQGADYINILSEPGINYKAAAKKKKATPPIPSRNEQDYFKKKELEHKQQQKPGQQQQQQQADDEEADGELTVAAAKTFKCPECSSKVLENTKYCMKCKKKVAAHKNKIAFEYTPGMFVKVITPDKSYEAFQIKRKLAGTEWEIADERGATQKASEHGAGKQVGGGYSIYSSIAGAKDFNDAKSKIASKKAQQLKPIPKNFAIQFGTARPAGLIQVSAWIDNKKVAEGVLDEDNSLKTYESLVAKIVELVKKSQ